MVYYTVRLSPDIQDRTTIVTEFGKFRYKRLPIGICASRNILKAKEDELLSDIEVFKTYIDGITVVSKDSFEYHI